MALDESRRLFKIKKMLESRAAIMAGIRAFFLEKGFLEIDTPLRVPAIAPEQFILPYTSEGWYLSTSPELQMKRLLSAGYEKIFQIAHCFRRDECGRQHNPEFTMLEWYRAAGDYNQIISDTEQLVIFLAHRFGYGDCLKYQGKSIDISLPWPRIGVREAYTKWAGWDPFINFDGQKFDDDLVEKVIPHFPANRPMVIMDYPLECAALARLKPGQTGVAERAEVFMVWKSIRPTAIKTTRWNSAGVSKMRWILCSKPVNPAYGRRNSLRLSKPCRNAAVLPWVWTAWSCSSVTPLPSMK
jgi:lysyl-tRNA synthetase class 2